MRGSHVAATAIVSGKASIVGSERTTPRVQRDGTYVARTMQRSMTPCIERVASPPDGIAMTARSVLATAKTARSIAVRARSLRPGSPPDDEEDRERPDHRPERAPAENPEEVVPASELVGDAVRDDERRPRERPDPEEAHHRAPALVALVVAVTRGDRAGDDPDGRRRVGRRHLGVEASRLGGMAPEAISPRT